MDVQGRYAITLAITGTLADLNECDLIYNEWLERHSAISSVFSIEHP
jgi:hypothetical protein